MLSESVYKFNHTFCRIPKKLHPTEKPVDLIKRFIRVSSQENDIVLDPFLGSGTTAVAAKDLNRKYIGYEIDSEYFNIAKERLEEIKLF